MGHDVAVVRGGKLVSHVSVAASAPRLLMAYPPALLAGSDGGTSLSLPHLGRAHAHEDASAASDDTAWDSGGEGPLVWGGRAAQGASAAVEAGGAAAGGGAGTVALFGQNISDPHDMVVCRQAGRWVQGRAAWPAGS